MKPTATTKETEKTCILANQNVWYHMITLYGEQSGNPFTAYNPELHEKNRNFWNRFISGALNPKDRKAILQLKDKYGNPRVTEEMIRPFDAIEIESIEKQFQIRCAGQFDKIPDVFGEFRLFFTVFDSPLVLDGYIFHEFIIFSHSIFNSTVDIKNCIFCGHAEFEHSHFNGRFFANNAFFLRESLFNDATFKQTASFSDAIFNSKFVIERGVFLHNVNFDKAEFRKNAIFFNTVFSEKHTSTFNTCVFKSASVFVNAKIEGNIIFNYSRFHRFPPKFHSAKINEVAYLNNIAWPPAPIEAVEAREHVANYQRLKQIMEGLKRHEDELDFFAREMQAQRVVDGGWRSLRGFVNGAYGMLSDYGRSIAVPATWLILIIFACFIALLAFEECPEKAPCEPIGRGKAISLAITSALGFLPLKKEIFSDLSVFSPAAHFFMATTTLLSFLFLFLIGLALRNRFRLK